MSYRRARLALFAIAFGAAHAHAQLPCGEPEEIPYQLRWRVPAGEVTGYRIHRGTQPGGRFTSEISGRDIADAHKNV